MMYETAHKHWKHCLFVNVFSSRRSLAKGSNEVEPVNNYVSVSHQLAHEITVAEIQTDVVEASNSIANPIKGTH